MPFDISLPTDVQNLLTLADALEREHNGFHWHFPTIYEVHNCGTVGCALGMAVHIGLMVNANSDQDRVLALYEEAEKTFGLTTDEANSLFANMRMDDREFYGVDDTDITPAMVAAELRRVAAEKMGR